MRWSFLIALAFASPLVACGAAPSPAVSPTTNTPAGSTESAVKARTELDEGERSIDASTSECACSTSLYCFASATIRLGTGRSASAPYRWNSPIAA